MATPVLPNVTPYATLAALEADSPSDGTIAVVYADPTPANNRSYVRQGGTWVTDFDPLIYALGNRFGFQQTGTGSVLWPYQSALQQMTMNVFQFMTATQIADVTSGNPAFDVTAAVQNAINEAATLGKKLIVNAGVYGLTINTVNTGNTALNIPSNSTIEFEPGAQFRLLGSFNYQYYQILSIVNAVSITLIRPYVDGRNAENSATGGEWGMGIYILSSSNILIDDATTVDTWGDGIYIARLAGGAQPTDIFVNRHTANGVRRNGVSLITGTNVHFAGCVWENITGTAPGAAIDIEPNDNTASLQLIKLTGCKSLNNTLGFTVSLGAFAGATAKQVSITFEQCCDMGSRASFNIGGHNPASGTVGGMIAIIDCSSLESQVTAFNVTEYPAVGPALIITRPYVENPNTSSGSSTTYYSPFAVYRAPGSTLTYPMGNVTFDGATLTMNSGSIPRLFNFADLVSGATTQIVNCNFRDPFMLSGISGAALIGYCQGTGSFSDKYNQMRYQLTASYAPLNILSNFQMPATAKTQQLPNAPAGYPDIVLTQVADVTQQFTTISGGNFVGQAAGTVLTLTAGGSIGAYVRFRSLGSNVWLVVEMVGPNWSWVP